MGKNSMANKRTLVLAASLCCFSCNLINPTSSDTSIAPPTYSVYLVEDPNAFQITSENPVKVERGQDARFTVKMRSGYVLNSLKRMDQEVNASFTNGVNDVTFITIPNILYSARFDVVCEEAMYGIVYYPNGGTYIDGSDPSLPFEVRHSLRNRLRPNTELGTDKLDKEGYVLTGWNTKADGTGERTGLGSRVTIPEGEEKISLYATWEKESPVEDFSYSLAGNKVYISSYHGEAKRVVVPSMIEGKTVTRILADSFMGEEESVILPFTITNVDTYAFRNSKVKELYFYDNLTEISDSSFQNCENFSTVHINAILPPRYGGKNLYSEINLADKYDILILHKDEKKLLVFGGSGSYLSVNTCKIEEALNDGTVCINMAVNGWFNGVAQFEMMYPYLKDGDTFIHAPETSSQFAMMRAVTMTPEIQGDDGRRFTYNKIRFYNCLESNYDLLGLVDIRHVENFLDGYSLFNSTRLRLEPTTYADYKTTVNLYSKTYDVDLAYIDDRGNFALGRPAGAGPKEAGEADIVLEYVAEEAAHNRLNHYFDWYREKGVTVYLSTAPINRDTLQKRLDEPEIFHTANAGNYLYYGRPEGIPDPDYDDINTWVNQYENVVDTYLNVDVLVPLSENIYHTEDYFEPDYHLCDEAGIIHTQKFIDALLAKRGGEA